MPVSWGGVAQPLALAGGQVSVNPAARANLDTDPEATIRRLRGAKGAKQLRSKERKLAELGEVRFVTATTPEEQFRFLTAFLRQKAEWFEKRNMSDAFADQPTKDFFEGMIQENASSDGNIIDFHVLLLDGHPIALYSGATHQKRLSLYTTSIVLDDEIGKSSPGELVLKAMIETACKQGIEIIDLGVGSSETKRRWLPDEEPIIDMIRGYGAGGCALAHVMSQMQTIKRVIKASPAMMSAVRKLRGASA
jgi:CelD/BcsL family acetyltransferase involved in cellulose biosynthesis